MKIYISGLATLLFCLLANGAVISKLEISAEKLYSSSSDICNYSEKSVANTAEEIVKRKGIFVGKGSDELVLGIDANLMPIEKSQNCIGYLQVEFKYYDLIKIKGSNRSKYGVNIICRRGKTFIFSKITLQEKLNEMVRTNTDECLTEINNYFGN